MAATLLAFGLAACSTSSGGLDGDAPEVDRPSASEAAAPEPPAFSEPEVAWPESGYGSIGDGGAGCLSISVPSGSEAYYVKLKSGASTVWDVFLTPGTTMEFPVPTGTYDLAYGAGTRWYGWSSSFGPYGAYSETSERFTFDSDSCWNVELILQPGGNLGSSGLSYSDF